MKKNPRNQEFAEEVRLLFQTILEELHYGYDTMGNLDSIIHKHMTNRMVATEDTAYRHYDNLKARGLFIETREVGAGTCIKLNPSHAGEEIDLIIAKVKMPDLPKKEAERDGE